MPCGGIYPIAGSWVAPYADRRMRCFHCNKVGVDLWCEEWDAPIHRACVESFLQTPDGEIVIKHGHSIVLEPNGPEVFWDDANHELRDASGVRIFPDISRLN